MKLFILVILGGLLVAAPAHACINDSITLQKEQEFKSQYQDELPRYDSGQADVVAWGATGAGLIFAACGIVIALPRFRRLGNRLDRQQKGRPADHLRGVPPPSAPSEGITADDPPPKA